MLSKLSPDAYRELEELLGAENISDEPGVMEGYIYHSFAEILGLKTRWCNYRPEAVVLPSCTQEVQGIVKICAKYNLRFHAMSTGWGAWNAPGSEGVIQIDLRRMNKLINIDAKNMYAVVEPYVVCSQLQAEAMRFNLNTHIIGAGCNTSPLASSTSLIGYGWSGLTTSYSARNVLGVEWVLPSGEVIRLGAIGQNEDTWFNADGPGPSIRGVMRGFAGACGGLGVFTKVALKLFPWPGPKEPEVKGVLLDYKTDVPKTHSIFLCAFPDIRNYADSVYKIADSEIGYMHCKNAIGLVAGLSMPKAFKKATQYKAIKSILETFKLSYQVVLATDSERSYDYQKKVLRKIVSDHQGIVLDISDIPGIIEVGWWGIIRAALPPLIFRMAGSFATAFGGLESFDHPVYQMQIGEKTKQSLIDEGYMIDDLADNGWGGIYEGSTGFGHCEELAYFDPRNPVHVQGILEYIPKTVEDTDKYHLSPGLAFGGGSIASEVLGPMMGNYHEWLRKIKTTFDPANSSDPVFYIQPDREVAIKQLMMMEEERHK